MVPYADDGYDPRDRGEQRQGADAAAASAAEGPAHHRPEPDDVIVGGAVDLAGAVGHLGLLLAADDAAPELARAAPAGRRNCFHMNTLHVLLKLTILGPEIDISNTSKSLCHSTYQILSCTAFLCWLRL